MMMTSVVRELTSQALHNLTERDPEYMKNEGATTAHVTKGKGELVVWLC